MQTTLDCIPCFMQQALKAARIIDPEDADLHKKVLLEWASMLPSLDLTVSPPALAGIMYKRLGALLGTRDIFAAVKEQANTEVQRFLPGFRATLAASDDPLFDALRLAIIGNYMDAGTPTQHAWEQAMHEERDATWASTHYPRFRHHLASARSVLILGDNAGEIVLDTLLVDELVRMGHKVTYAVRGTPILNDATMEDAKRVGMVDRCEVITSGVDTPGTVLERCTPDFLHRLDQAEVIISKGQGNFEALKGERTGIYFAFKVKCPVVAAMTGRPEKTSIFEYI
ncbi:damage-control phosphatase ARMT1 family protein [Desulfoplanes formicivorans]|uniref:Damage-control phosphatase ARMT1-like metal-binding domain-containing protein n=1 Tax=Desulfoplanes formicivorans TaxID=1592317 RepID=A0A194AI21_9BACT|nr:ARMT1-like domain-containing protein [Desulfoplanes formicivorans]GAU08875.1 hypothetical protein DPF_1592 [Desulfoplanes formicivorans]